MTISLEQTDELLREIESAVHALGKNFDPPQFVKVNGVPEFRHDEKNDLLLSYLKCIRSISSLNAAAKLLRYGYVQEVGVLCRCADEFCEDVVFLSVPLGPDGTYNSHQVQMVEEFFQEELPERGTVMARTAGRRRVPRDKVRAGIARINGMPINPHDANQVHRVLGHAFSGYVHGAYPHIMEMYGGDSAASCRFHTSGMLGTPRINEVGPALASYVYRLAIASEIVARRCGDKAAGSKLESVRGTFERATGMGLSDPKAALARVKARL